MPRWPMTLFAVVFMLMTPWIVATLFILGACMMWFRTYKFTLPLLAIFGAMAWFGYVTMAHAQGWANIPPGGMPTTIMPWGDGGYIVNTPHQVPTTVTPFGNGYIVNGPQPFR